MSNLHINHPDQDTARPIIQSYTNYRLFLKDLIIHLKSINSNFSYRYHVASSIKRTLEPRRIPFSFKRGILL